MPVLFFSLFPSPTSPTVQRLFNIASEKKKVLQALLLKFVKMKNALGSYIRRSLAEAYPGVHLVIAQAEEMSDALNALGKFCYRA
jgi:hypothetical protein